LIFLLNFSDEEYSAIELYLSQASDKALPIYKIVSSDSSISNKRLDLYLRGGVFSVSYKILVLDILTKRLSPAIISGLILNNANKSSGRGKSGESFICEILRKGNSHVFIKAITEKP
jgi:DNA excision repair protein ERCC-4